MLHQDLQLAIPQNHCQVMYVMKIAKASYFQWMNGSSGDDDDILMLVSVMKKW